MIILLTQCTSLWNVGLTTGVSTEIKLIFGLKITINGYMYLW